MSSLNRAVFVLFLAAVIVCSGPAGFANEEKSHELKDGVNLMEKRIEYLKNELALNEDQTVKIRAIFETSKAEREAAKKKMQNEVASVLDDNQKAKYESLKDKKPGFGKWEKNRQRGRGPNG